MSQSCNFCTGIPTAAHWMPIPQAPVGCPPGLEYLTQIDQLLVKQQVELLEGMAFFIKKFYILLNRLIHWTTVFLAKLSHCILDRYLITKLLGQLLDFNHASWTFTSSREI